MRAFVVREPHQAAVEEVEEARPGPGEVLVRVVAAGICGSDLEVLDGRRPPPYIRYPVIPGHEWAGCIAELGPGAAELAAGEPLAVGDPVVAEGLRSCGVCARCAEGRNNLCSTPYAETGFTHPGALAETLVVPARLIHRPPKDRPVVPAALLEPAACVANGLLEAGVPRPGARVAVVGDGPLGLLAVLLLRRCAPAALLLVSRRPARGARGLELGATRMVNARDAAALDRERGAYDLVVDTTNSPEGPAASLRLLRRGGSAVLLGISGAGRASIDPDVIALNHLRVFGIFAASRMAWQWLVDLYAQGVFDPSPLITHCYRLEELPAALATLASRESGAIKVLITPNGADDQVTAA
jgi:threonine dehydrogenase-like Zn-dependent dehydrogenase